MKGSYWQGALKFVVLQGGAYDIQILLYLPLRILERTPTDYSSIALQACSLISPLSSM